MNANKIIVILNPCSKRGQGQEIWESLFPMLDARFGPLLVNRTTSMDQLPALVEELIGNGHRRFVSASGDGGVNQLINAIMLARGEIPLSEFTIGAIALGSSNDYHKPYGNLIRQVPVRLDFDHARPRAVGAVEHLDESGRMHTRYFLTSASVGVTAEANALFNRRQAAVRALSRIDFNLAVFWIFLQTLKSFKNIPLGITLDDQETFFQDTMYLAVSKTPYISGLFRFREEVSRYGRRFLVKIIRGCGKLTAVRMLLGLGRGREMGSENIITRYAGDVRASCSEPFVLEIDGETLMTRSARFYSFAESIRECI